MIVVSVYVRRRASDESQAPDCHQHLVRRGVLCRRGIQRGVNATSVPTLHTYAARLYRGGVHGQTRPRLSLHRRLSPRRRDNIGLGTPQCGKGIGGGEGAGDGGVVDRTSLPYGSIPLAPPRRPLLIHSDRNKRRSKYAGARVRCTRIETTITGSNVHSGKFECIDVPATGCPCTCNKYETR